ncbi:MAG: nitroreductase family protein [Deltaproteobacteria bacterium]|nr:nitroreductase family protein [Deltaproteobacteria bacterium]
MPEHDPAHLLDLIRSRRSVRRFRPDPLPDGAAERLLAAMVLAPSAGNAQPWHFVCIAEPRLRQELAAAALRQRFVADAPLVVVVCVDEARAARAYGERGVSLYCLQDTAAAIQNMLLVAHAMGLGTCWVGAFDEQAVAQVLELRDGLRPVALVPVGVPAERPRMPPRRPVGEVSEWR